ncbi:MAG TPA: UDP-glucose/GDP-mannose dehydrogenase family protein [Cyclobacteriaceae bacterium]|nr:UDP-glucose/GDP-mannose dehydrogenase family protein [Cyclobacteriaceae bacterium]
MNVSVLGLGYVGAVSSACFSNLGHTVFGVDVNAQKVGFINEGKSPIVEAELEELIGKGINNKKLSATTDLSKAIHSTEISIICVGTPSQPNGGIDLTHIYEICTEIGKILKDKKSFHTVVIRSTVSPGTVAYCAELISRESGKTLNVDFGMASNPEFLREGTAVKDFFGPPYTIIGATCPQSEEVLKKLYEGIEAPVYTMKSAEAEMIKYANNNFHALKVTFANEIGNICKELSIDGHKVMDIVTKDTKLNLSPYYMKPGFAFGGSCLPKDVRALNYKANSMDLKVPMLSSLMLSNEYQLQRVLQMVYNTKKKKVGILGFAFKNGTDDLRESPVVSLIETLFGKGYKLNIYDSNVSYARLLGKNKEYIETHVPHMVDLIRNTIDEVCKESEVIIIGNRSKEFKRVFELVTPSQTIIDLVRIDEERTTSGNYVGICW